MKHIFLGALILLAEILTAPVVGSLVWRGLTITLGYIGVETRDANFIAGASGALIGVLWVVGGVFAATAVGMTPFVVGDLDLPEPKPKTRKRAKP